MTRLARIVLIGNSLPRRCGIATFTSDLRAALVDARPRVAASIVAMNDPGQAYDYPPEVMLGLDQEDPGAYAAASGVLNEVSADVVSLQHEFGIFGGDDGEEILPLISALDMPVVTTLHTVLAKPSENQRAVIGDIARRSARVVVMAEKGRELLRSVYGVGKDKIAVIPHGIPDMPFVEPDAAKARLGFSGKSVILTFGLLSPNKGIEVMIDAMPAVLAACPNAVYVVLGATHPTLVRQHGEAYRESLAARARDLGVGDHVVFRDQFVDQDLLLEYIAMCDVYVTPYLNEEQMTSGTLAWSFGLGKAVVSTPYWHAKELLADGCGVLVPFRDAQALGEDVSKLLVDDNRRMVLRRRAYAASRSMTWARTAERYLELFEAVRPRNRLGVVPLPITSTPLGARPTPAVRTERFLEMCDDTGMLQHAVYTIADRSHGYCVDDNARALMMSALLGTSSDAAIPGAVITRFAAFVQHAWNPDTKRFRNFMSYDRRWLEAEGSEDSHGRTVWALGVCARDDVDAARRRWATALFDRSVGVVEDLVAPRSWAFALLGIDAVRMARPLDPATRRLRSVLAGRLMNRLSEVEGPEWMWFDHALAYDNARLPQALIATGLATGNSTMVGAGLRTLRWLMRHQTSPTGLFRPVGSHTFGRKRVEPRPFDQQPIEAAATVSACLEAARADGDPRWPRDARRAFAWFLGENDLGIPLVDVASGGCRDGLHPDRANENQGAESLLSYLLALTEIRRLDRSEMDEKAAHPPRIHRGA